MPPAARITDMHVCPMVTPGLPPIPHVGGPVIGPCVPNVLIGKLPAAVVGDNAVCVANPCSADLVDFIESDRRQKALIKLEFVFDIRNGFVVQERTNVLRSKTRGCPALAADKRALDTS